MLRNRRSVAPVIATLLMVAIAVVGGMLVFVFAQDFFTATDNLAGPTIELLQIFGYDFRDRATGATTAIENHDGSVCGVTGVSGGTLADGDVVALYVRNLGSVDIVISDVSINNFKLDALTTAATMAAGTVPVSPQWGVVASVIVDGVEVCEDELLGSGNLIGPGRDATIIMAFGDTTETGDPVKLGRPIFIKVETGGGNIFSKQVVNGRQVG